MSNNNYNSTTFQFDMTPIKPALITVIGVGGGGGNAVNHMFNKGIDKVNFVVCNTDKQALIASPIPHKIQLGAGLGAGNMPDRATIAAEDSIEIIRETLETTNTQMLFITAGMGGGTGTGASPVIAKAAKEMGILTVAVVSIPIESEGRKRLTNAIDGVDKLAKIVDSIIIINTEHTVEFYGDLPMSAAYDVANEMLRTAVKSMSDIINNPLYINVDFEDAKTVLKDTGLAVMGTAEVEGEGRAIKAIEEALLSPLLHHTDIKGAQNVLLKITSSSKQETTLRESNQILQYIQERSATENSTNVIWGAGIEDDLDEKIRVTVIATGFKLDKVIDVREFYKKTFGVKPSAITLATPAAQLPNVIRIGDDNVEIKATTVQHSYDEEDFKVVTSGGNNNGNNNVVSENYRVREPEYTTPKPIQMTETVAAMKHNNAQAAVQPHEKTPTEAPVIQPKADDVAHKTIYDMTEEEIDLIPAWKRNPVQGFMDDEPTSQQKNASIVVEDDAAYQPQSETRRLFE